MILPLLGLAGLLAFLLAVSKDDKSLPSGADDDAFDALVAAAIAKGDIAALTALAEQAEKRGLTAEAKSIRDEIARLQQSAPPTPPPKKDGTATPTGRATIQQGSRGTDVVEWQRIIGVKQDGIFGPETAAKTKAWQTAHGLTADGIVGPKTWAAAYAKDPSLATKPPPPVPASLPAVPTPPAERPTIKLGSKGATVVEWQKALGQLPADGDFDGGLDTATRVWQKAHGLTPDGIVGPKTWGVMTGKIVIVDDQPRPGAGVPLGPIAVKPAAAPSSGATSTPVIQRGSTGAAVSKWQACIGVKADGIFGAETEAATRAWQTAHGLKADGIVGPLTWATCGQAPQLPAPAPAPAPQLPAAPPDHDADTAADELTSYLQSLGGLAGRYKENRSRVSEWLTRLGVPDPKGMYGRDAAKAVMMHGVVPVAPYYWPSSGTQTAKNQFLDLVNQYAGADPQRADQWNKLKSDTVRS